MTWLTTTTTSATATATTTASKHQSVTNTGNSIATNCPTTSTYTTTGIIEVIVILLTSYNFISQPHLSTSDPSLFSSHIPSTEGNCRLYNSICNY